jgi:transcriptional regulator with XRE-family HTH domain
LTKEEDKMLKISLEAARVNAGYSQKEAAEKLDVSNKTLCNWESGKAYPRADKIVAICNLYGVPYDNIKFLPNDSL